MEAVRCMCSVCEIIRIVIVIDASRRDYMRATKLMRGSGFSELIPRGVKTMICIRKRANRRQSTLLRAKTREMTARVHDNE